MTDRVWRDHPCSPGSEKIPDAQREHGRAQRQACEERPHQNHRDEKDAKDQRPAGKSHGAAYVKADSLFEAQQPSPLQTVVKANRIDPLHSQRGTMEPSRGSTRSRTSKALPRIHKMVSPG